MLQMLINLGDEVVAVLLKGVVKVSLPLPLAGSVPHGLLSSSFWMTGLMVPPPECRR